jgi:hypothetical protein
MECLPVDDLPEFPPKNQIELSDARHCTQLPATIALAQAVPIYIARKGAHSREWAPSFSRAIRTMNNYLASEVVAV